MPNIFDKLPQPSKSTAVRQVDRMADMLKAVSVLTGTQIVVGVPKERNERPGESIGNAALAYIHDHGAPEAHIPARPFMEPGMKAVQQQVSDLLQKAGEKAFQGASEDVILRILHQVGMVAAQSIKNHISQGIPPPLAPSTVQGRINRLKGKKRRKTLHASLEAGTPASIQGGAEGLFLPLVVTGSMRNAITYVLRKVGAR